MLTVLFSFLIGLLAFYNYKIGKTYLYPPVIFSILWTGLLLALFLAGSMFYSITLETLIIYFLGTLAFSIGGFIAIAIFIKRGMSSVKIENDHNKSMREYKNYFINLTLLIAIIAFPFYYSRLTEIASYSGFENIWSAIRYETVYGDVRLGLWSYMVGFVRFGAAISFLEYRIKNTGKIRAIIFIVISLAYDLFSMARTGAFFLLFMIFGQEIIMRKRINFRSILLIFIIIFLIFSIPGVLLEKVGSPLFSPYENLRSIFNSIMVYSLGGLVAFDNVVNNSDFYSGPRIVTFRFFIALLNRLGLSSYYVPRYIPIITYTPAETNVYTIYFSYFLDYGIAGIIICMLLVGFLCSLIFVKAYFQKSPSYVFLYGMIVPSILVSSLNEAFITALSYWLQAFIFLFFIYIFPKCFFKTKIIKLESS